MLENNTICILQSASVRPQVTIAIPTFKRSALLRDALDSALCQLWFENYEVLVCDNNPERGDETEILMSTYDNTRLSYYKNHENLGIVGNWNQLYHLAKGEWIVMLHDDDMLAPFFLHYIFNSDDRIYEKGDLIFPSFTSSESRFSYANADKDRKITYPKLIDFVGFNLIGPPLGMTIKKDAKIEIGDFVLRNYPSPDYDYYVRTLLKGYKIVKLLGEPMAYYRISVNESLKAEIQIGFIKNKFEIGNYIVNKFPAIIRLFLGAYNDLTSYLMAKSRQKEYPEDNILSNSEK